jgi:DNA-nicking Smr family endonuclease
MNEIDLHGISHEDAMMLVEDFVYVESQQFGFVCKVITGNSSKLQSKILTFLQENGFSYYIPVYNMGEIIISE